TNLSSRIEDLNLLYQGLLSDCAKANGELPDIVQRVMEALAETLESLKLTGQQAEAVLSDAVDAIIIINETGVVQYFNPAAEQTFGYEPSEVIGRNIAILMPTPYKQEHNGYLMNYLRTGVKKVIGIGREVVGRRKDGVTFPMELAITEARIGEQRYFTGTARDITERKRLEKEVLDISTEEQKRIGRDLHDGLGQELTGIALLSGVLERKLKNKGLEEAADAAEIVKLVNNTISHTRALVKGLSPVIQEVDGLMLAMQELAENTAHRYDCKCQFICEKPILTDNYPTAMHLYYIAYEAIHNAIRHGKAKRITIRISQNPQHACLQIADDGAGYSPSQNATGRGIHIMRYRARMIKGTLDVYQPEQGGAVVNCTFGADQIGAINPQERGSHG
ncbi:MAG: sensor histidine kinase, partial [Planctomycetota bacterium]